MVRNPRVGETVFINTGVGKYRRVGYVTKVSPDGDINAAVFDEDGAHMGGFQNVGPFGKRPDGHFYWYWTEDKKPESKENAKPPVQAESGEPFKGGPGTI